MSKASRATHSPWQNNSVNSQDDRRRCRNYYDLTPISEQAQKD